MGSSAMGDFWQCLADSLEQPQTKLADILAESISWVIVFVTDYSLDLKLSIITVIKHGYNELFRSELNNC